MYGHVYFDFEQVFLSSNQISIKIHGLASNPFMCGKTKYNILTCFIYAFQGRYLFVLKRVFDSFPFRFRYVFVAFRF